MPPYRWTGGVRTLKAPSMISVHSSGSSFSASVVEPFTSQNRTVTTLRSDEPVVLRSGMRFPQLLQNFAVSGFSVLHTGQRTLSKPRRPLMA